MPEKTGGLEELAYSVLEFYNVNPVSIQIVQQGGIKTVWKVKTGSGLLCLKRLNKTMDKALFSAEAQKYIKANGGFVPGVLANKTGEPITTYLDALFVLYEWVEGRQLSFSVEEDFAAALRGLGLFHKQSKGYVPPLEARVSTKLSKWPQQYRSMLSRLQEWKNVSQQKAGTAFTAYLKWADPIIALGEKAIEHLEKSRYDQLSAPGSPAVVLCHQDFGKGNALLTPNGICVLDLDGVTFELAARDLRKIILKTMENQNGCDEQTIRKIITWYEQGNALTDDEKKMVYIDCLFPHGFFGCVKNQFIKNKSVKASNIEQIGRLELSKPTVLNRLLEGESS